MLCAGDLKKALADVPDDALLSVGVTLRESGEWVAAANVGDVVLEGPDDLGFTSLVVNARMLTDDLATSSALPLLPERSLEHVLKTGKPAPMEGLLGGLCEEPGCQNTDSAGKRHP